MLSNIAISYHFNTNPNAAEKKKKPSAMTWF
jgi:hypothetical protein